MENLLNQIKNMTGLSTSMLIVIASALLLVVAFVVVVIILAVKQKKAKRNASATVSMGDINISGEVIGTPDIITQEPASQFANDTIATESAVTNNTVADNTVTDNSVNQNSVLTAETKTSDNIEEVSDALAKDRAVMNKQKPLKKKDLPKKKKKSKIVARTVQEVLDFDDITTDGIIIAKDCYSKLYRLTDSNFITEPKDKQEDFLEDYTKLVNRFPDNVTMSIVIVNKANTEEDLSSAFHLRERGDAYDNYRDCYNDVVDVKISEGRNDISKDKYILLTAKERSLTDATDTFNTVDLSVNDAVKAINRVGVHQVGAIERLSVIRDILNGTTCVPFEKEYAKFIMHISNGEGEETTTLDLKAMRRAGFTVKDLVAPQTITRVKQNLMLAENRYCRSLSFANLPQELDTSFLTKATNMSNEMVTVVQLKSVPRRRAVQMVKMQNTSIKADVIKASKVAFKSGYDPSLMDEDLQNAQVEAKKLRNDVVNGGRKLFFATMTVTIFGETEEEVKKFVNNYSAICNDFSLTPSYLIGQQIQALNGSCLFGLNKIITDRLLTSDDVQALFPFNIQELQERHGRFYGINAISKSMIMYDRKRSKLAHALIFGQSGSGKSFIGKGEIIPTILDTEDDIIILDPENEYSVVAREFGGTVIDLELKSDYCINPCDMSMEWNDPKATPLADKCDYMVSLVESILGKGRECNSFEVNAIHKATEAMYEEYIEVMTQRKEDGNPMDIDTELSPTLVDFFECLMAQQTPEANKIASQIEPYCVGQYNIFAHKTNVPTSSRITVYNLLPLPDKMREVAMKVCLANIWTKVVKNRENNEKYGLTKAIWVYLDEFHLFFQTEASVNTIMAYWKRMRKYNGILTGLTQDCSDLLRTHQGTAMFNNTGFFIFLNQSTLGRNQLQQLYDISDTMIEYIKDKPQGQGLIYNGSVLIPFDYKLPTNNKLYELMSTNPNEVKK